jgi:cystathionine beta-lyase
MVYDFDEVIDRRSSDSEKWNQYEADVLPLWVADMDFRVAEPILRALHDRLSHGVFGYGEDGPGLREAVSERMERLYGWKVHPDEVVLFPGVITGFNLACQAFTKAGEGVLVQTPVYPPFLSAPLNAGALRQEMELSRQPDGRYTIDFERFESAMDLTTRLFLLCNPHNPVGRVYTREELQAMAEICLKRNVLICADEIHGELVFEGHRHIPIASLSPEISQATITLGSPSKAFNIPGLYCSYAIIQNPELRRRFQAARRGLVGHGNILGMVAGEAAYREGDEWLTQVLRYLQANRDLLFNVLQETMPDLKMALPEGTYLAWIDCRSAGICEKPGEFFLKEARVALVDGEVFGKGGDGFVRLNFGCRRGVLLEALERMREALVRK